VPDATFVPVVYTHVVGLFRVDPSANSTGSANCEAAKSLTLIRRIKLATFFNSNVGFEPAKAVRQACPKPS
jgi:hypothetical protein